MKKIIFIAIGLVVVGLLAVVILGGKNKSQNQAQNQTVTSSPVQAPVNQTSRSYYMGLSLLMPPQAILMRSSPKNLRSLPIMPTHCSNTPMCLGKRCFPALLLISLPIIFLPQ